MTIIHWWTDKLEPKDWWMWVCCHLQSIHVNSSTCNNWQVISALADADEFGGCRFQWIWRRKSPFSRRVASKVFPGGYGSVTCVGVCFLRCKPLKWQTSSKFRACGDLLVVCYVESEILYKLTEIWNLHGVSPDVATCNFKLFRTYVQKASLFPKGNWWPTALLCAFHILWVGRKHFVRPTSFPYEITWGCFTVFKSFYIVGTRI